MGFPNPFLGFHFLLLVSSVHLSISNPDQLYNSCGNTFNCGSLTGIGYPFRGFGESEVCGYPGLVLNCRNSVPMIEIVNVTYRVLNMNPSAKTMRIAREDVMEADCPHVLLNSTLDYSIFDYVPGYMNLTFLYGCPKGYSDSDSDSENPGLGIYSSCEVNGYDEIYILPGAQGPGTCKASISVPVLQAGWGEPGNSTDWVHILRNGFEIRWKADDEACNGCTESSGRCGYNLMEKQSTCYCRDPPYISDRCSGINGTMPGKKKNGVALAVGLSLGGAALLGLGAALLLITRRKKKKLAAESAQTKNKDLPSPYSSNGLTTTTTNTSTNFSGSIPSYPNSKYDLEKGSTYFGVHVFSYAELEEATNNFDSSRELGDGGFGTVYYGKLQDGRVVAVKRLYENNFKRVEQFMNEVEILTRLRHQNLVKLFGCTSKRSRELLLVYEYISNGTVADHVHGKRANSGLLSWPVRLNVAIETADALAYLHASEIIHRDVKTNNILLESDFTVKVADFGLSRLFPTDVTHVSTAPQGTPGYVDPEYYQCYQLTSKSDVYSFGVVLIELISSKQAVDTNRHRHDINLANMAVNKIQNHALHELVDPTLGFETNSSAKRMITLVAELAFRCLQQDKDMRPTMEEVLVALKRIKNEDNDEEKAEVLDIIDDDIGLLKANSPPISPKSGDTEKLFSSSTTPSS